MTRVQISHWENPWGRERRFEYLALGTSQMIPFCFYVLLSLLSYIASIISLWYEDFHPLLASSFNPTWRFQREAKWDACCTVLLSRMPGLLAQSCSAFSFALPRRSATSGQVAKPGRRSNHGQRLGQFRASWYTWSLAIPAGYFANFLGPSLLYGSRKQDFLCRVRLGPAFGTKWPWSSFLLSG